MACLPRFRFRLGVPDLVFGIVLVTILSGSVQLLNDPGTFWHARLGREIARTGDVPRLDVLTFTRDHAPWIDQSWAFDWGLAAVVDRWGWSAAVALAALGLAALYGIMARGLIRDGTSPLIAFSVTLFAAWVGTIHFLIRPHLFTFGFFYWTLRSCQMQHKRGGWAIASLPLVMVLWANVHGGFLAGLVIVGTAAVAHAISGSWDQARRVNLARFAGIFLLCSLAPLINPYGVGLYRHVGQFVSGAASLTLEFQPIQFGQGQARLVEWVLLALIAIPTFSSRRMDRYNLAHALVWLHLALVSVRHRAALRAGGCTGPSSGSRRPHSRRVRRRERPDRLVDLARRDGFGHFAGGLPRDPVCTVRSQDLAAPGGPGARLPAARGSAVPRTRLGRIDRVRMPAGSTGLHR